MMLRKHFVKTLPLFLAALFLAASGSAGEAKKLTPHMMYFYNPSCRLCTKTNEVVGAAETKYKDTVSAQRYNIADNEEGTENVIYMFSLLDTMKVPEDDTVTLVVFLGFLTEEDGEVFFTPSRVLVEGDHIIKNLDQEIADFLEKDVKGGKTLGMTVRPAGFFRLDTGLCRHAS